MSDERISQLERSVKRWRLVSLALLLLLICAVAIGGIILALPPTQEHGNFWLILPWVRARAAREEAVRAEQEVRALQAADAARRAAEAAKKAGVGVGKKVP